MSKSYKAPYQESLKEIRQKDALITQLQAQVSELQSKAESQVEAHTTKLQAVTDEKTQLQEQCDVLEGEKGELVTELESKDERIRNMELSRFASAYKSQETAYGTQETQWFKLAIGSTALLTGSVLISTFGIPYHGIWYKEPGFYLLNAIFVTLFIYTLKQHAHMGNLKVDYANRKALAQSYQHIVEKTDDEHTEIEQKFFERAAAIFTSKPMMRSTNVTLYEAILAKFLGPKG